MKYSAIPPNPAIKKKRLVGVTRPKEEKPDSMLVTKEDISKRKLENAFMGGREAVPFSHLSRFPLSPLYVEVPGCLCSADCGYCGRCDSPLQDLPPTESENYFAHLNYVLTKKAKKKKKKGRQGRSAESRERAKRIKEEWRSMVRQGLVQDDEEPVCKECNDPDLIEDQHSGDLICTNCGIVQISKGLGFNCLVTQKTKFSKPYQPLVHFRQRLAQLTGKDPLINDEIWEKLKTVIETRKLDDSRLGKKTISKLLIELKLPRRLSANWIQVRSRLNLEPHPPEIDDPETLWKRLNARYFCVTIAFQRTLKKLGPQESKGRNLFRKNIINVNYSFLQLLRQENPDFLEHFGKFFPQLSSKEQPGRNNKRWKILMEYCKKNYETYSCPKTGERFKFKWDFFPLSTLDIMEHCVYFD